MNYKLTVSDKSDLLPSTPGLYVNGVGDISLPITDHQVT